MYVIITAQPALTPVPRPSPLLVLFASASRPLSTPPPPFPQDYGGHDFAITGNVVYHGQNDGQNCFNSWPFLPGHGAVYEDNVCVLPKSTNLGNLFHGCTCPGPAVNPNEPWTPGAANPPAECGVAFARNSYYTMNGTGSISCETPGLPFPAWQKSGADAGSTLKGLPSDDELLTWARSKLDGV